MACTEQLIGWAEMKLRRHYLSHSGDANGHPHGCVHHRGLNEDGEQVERDPAHVVDAGNDERPIADNPRTALIAQAGDNERLVWRRDREIHVDPH